MGVQARELKTKLTSDTADFGEILLEAQMVQKAYERAEARDFAVILPKAEREREEEFKTTLQKDEKFDYESVPVPRRPQWSNDMSAEELDAREQNAFLDWRW